MKNNNTFLSIICVLLISVLLNGYFIYDKFFHKPNTVVSSGGLYIQERENKITLKVPKEIQDWLDRYEFTAETLTQITATNTDTSKPTVIYVPTNSSCKSAFKFSDFRLDGYADAATEYIDYNLHQNFIIYIVDTRKSNFPYKPTTETIVKAVETDKGGVVKNDLVIKEIVSQRNIDFIKFNPTLMAGVAYPLSVQAYINLFDINPQSIFKYLKEDTVTLLGIGASKNFDPNIDTNINALLVPVGINLSNVTSLLSDTWVNFSVNSDFKGYYPAISITTKF